MPAGIALAALFIFSWAVETSAALNSIILLFTIVPLFITAFVVAVRSPALKENSAMRLYLAALIAFILGVFARVTLDHVLYMSGLIVNLFLILSQSLVLARQYTDAFKFVEETNTNLEQIVDERTQRLQTANDAMFATNNAMKELITNISHDLKTPLSVLSVNLEKLGEMSLHLDDAEYQRHVNIAYHKNLDMQRLLQNLFEASRIESGRSMYEPKWVSLNELLSDVQQKYGDFLESRGIDLYISSGDDAEISIDPQKIWSVFDNIIYNSMRYTDEGGSISLTAENQNGNVLVSVSDTGCGVEPEHLPHIFERFYKGSAERGKSEGDSGLGLYIVKSIMEGLGGSVSAKSELGKNTVILLSFIRRS